jgi:short subunit dehydrogenase-like uncharacterized protein
MTVEQLSRDFDLVVYGATGFTGALVAEYLNEIKPQLRWAIAGRDSTKLEQLRTRFGRPDLPIVIADANQPDTLEQLAAKSRVIISTVGPYAQYGTALVKACADHGTHYCDLTGEPQWMAAIYPEVNGRAQETGARIVHCCGFDSIPSDLSVYLAQKTFRERYGVYATTVSGRMGRSLGAASGGTIASMLLAVEQAASDTAIRRLLANPYSLYPEDLPAGPRVDEIKRATWDEQFNSWVGPFVMAAINTKVVNRSNALMGLPYSDQFRYDEAQLCKQRRQAVLLSLGSAAGMLAAALTPTRALLRKVLPKPGEGPNAELREKGFFEFYAQAHHPEDPAASVRIKVSGRRDPGYGATSRMLAQSGLCLAEDDLTVGGGVWTTASAMAEPLLQRLAKVDVEFSEIQANQS